jgi:hypothetical protein
VGSFDDLANDAQHSGVQRIMLGGPDRSGTGSGVDKEAIDAALLTLMQRWSACTTTTTNDNLLGQVLAELAAEKKDNQQSGSVIDLVFSGGW